MSVLSGFCNPSHPKDSHERCRKHDCPCEHHKPKGATDIKPGLYDGISDEDYHADPIVGGSLSSTLVRLLTNHVPAKADAIRRNRKPTKAMNLGKAVHSTILGSGPELITWEHDGRTKEGKAERLEMAPRIASEAAVAVTAAERDQILGMVDALHTHPEVTAILAASKAEVSGFWIEGDDVWCRARYDILGDDTAYDYKTTQDASRRGFSKSLGAYGYHQQAEFYRRGLQAFGHPASVPPLRFICQEMEAPHLVQIHTPDDEAMTFAALLNDSAIKVYADAKASGVWPGYPELVAEPTPLPAWYFYAHEDEFDYNRVELNLS